MLSLWLGCPTCGLGCSVLGLSALSRDWDAQPVFWGALNRVWSALPRVQGAHLVVWGTLPVVLDAQPWAEVPYLGFRMLSLWFGEPFPESGAPCPGLGCPAQGDLSQEDLTHTQTMLAHTHHA